jgi:CHAT domain-containing protein/tetratricopeptide (TPR) repeat protein
MATPDFDPNQRLPHLSYALVPSSVRISAWAHKEMPMEPVPLAPDLAQVSDAVLKVLTHFTGNEDIPAFRAAVAAGDPDALNALQHIMNDLGELVPPLVQSCQQWLAQGEFQAVIGQGPPIALLASVIGFDTGAALSLAATAKSFWRTGDASGAVSMYLEAIAVAEHRQQEMQSLLAACHDNLALALSELNRLDEAISHYRISAQLETNPDGQLHIRNNLAMTYQKIGEYATAARIHEDVVTKLSERHANSALLAAALDNWAVALIDKGDVPKAIELLERAAPMFAEQALDDRWRNASNRMTAYNYADRPADAARTFHETWNLAVERAHQFDVDHFRTGYRNALARLVPTDHIAWSYAIAAAQALDDNHQWEVAIQHYVEAANAASEAGDALMYLRCRANVAAVLADAQQVGDAWAECLSVQRAAQSLGLPLPMVLTAVTMSSILQGGSDEGGEAQALAISAQGLAFAELRDKLAVEAGFPPEHIERMEPGDVGILHAQVAQAAKQANAYDLAEEFFNNAIASAEHLGYRFGELNRKVGLLTVLDKIPERAADAEACARELRAELDRDDTSTITRLVVNRCLGTRKPDAAESLPDLRAAAQLLETVRAQRPPGVARSDLDREYGVYRSLLWNLQRSDAPALDAFEALQAMRARRLMETLTAAGGDTAPYKPITVDEIITLLMRQPRLTTFVDVTLTENGLRAYVIDHTGLRTVDAVGDNEPLLRVQSGDVRDRAADVVGLVTHSPLLAELAAVITRNLEANSTILRAVDDVLSNLPLHAIPIDGAPWGEHVSMGRIPAAGVLRFTPATRSWAGHSVVAGDSNDDLPGAARECAEVAALLGVPAMIADDCTIDAVRDALSATPETRLDLVHLAVHGRADVRRGGRSSLLFAGKPPTWIAFSDLAELPWRANLIVFSGCSTAVGGPRDGLGLYGVAQAAAEAGATTVIASLWPVIDSSAAVFMTAFHEELSRRRGTGVVDLRELMDHARAHLRDTVDSGAHSGVPRDGRELIIGDDDPESQAPTDTTLTAMLDWAPFVLIGEPTLVV